MILRNCLLTIWDSSYWECWNTATNSGTIRSESLASAIEVMPPPAVLVLTWLRTRHLISSHCHHLLLLPNTFLPVTPPPNDDNSPITARGRWKYGLGATDRIAGTRSCFRQSFRKLAAR